MGQKAFTSCTFWFLFGVNRSAWQDEFTKLQLLLTDDFTYISCVTCGNLMGIWCELQGLLFLKSCARVQIRIRESVRMCGVIQTLLKMAPNVNKRTGKAISRSSLSCQLVCRKKNLGLLCRGGRKLSVQIAPWGTRRSLEPRRAICTSSLRPPRHKSPRFYIKYCQNWEIYIEFSKTRN